ncbi:uncharacterized protein LOC115065365 [Mus pahari]|uniref:uncharacterized protein LOC115065365 n=1 Tax=Mus pahari TaxID=10093 RepID=UPI001114D35F|nr:uncharacterized protein LOC115065365 [Mus pahari]
MGGRGPCRRLVGWTLGRERDGPQVGRGWRGREARWVRVSPQVLGKGPQCCAQPEVRRYLLWKRNMPWVALHGFPSHPKEMLGPEAPGQGSQATPDQATVKTSTFGSLLAIQKEDSGQQRGVQLCRPDRQLRMGRAQWLPPWEPTVGSPEPLSHTEAKVATSSPPLGVCCHMTPCHQPGHSFPEIPSPSSTSAPLTPLADGTPPCPSAETGRLLGPVSMRGTSRSPPMCCVPILCPNHLLRVFPPSTASSSCQTGAFWNRDRASFAWRWSCPQREAQEAVWPCWNCVLVLSVGWEGRGEVL